MLTLYYFLLGRVPRDYARWQGYEAQEYETQALDFFYIYKKLNIFSLNQKLLLMTDMCDWKFQYIIWQELSSNY